MITYRRLPLCLAFASQDRRPTSSLCSKAPQNSSRSAGEIIGLLVESGADPGLVDVGPLENTALHLAARLELGSWVALRVENCSGVAAWALHLRG